MNTQLVEIQPRELKFVCKSTAIYCIDIYSGLSLWILALIEIIHASHCT